MPDIELHKAMIGLIVCYTLLGALIFTVLITCLSMIGVIVFKHPSQQKLMFKVLVVELVTGCVAYFFGFLQPSPKAAQNEITKPLAAEASKLGSENQILVAELRNSKTTLAQAEANLALAQEAVTAKSTEVTAIKDRLEKKSTELLILLRHQGDSLESRPASSDP